MLAAMGTTDELLAEQIAYYRARAPEYFDGVIPRAVGGGEIEAALDSSPEMLAPDELIEGESPSTQLGWRISVTRTSRPFCWGEGARG